MYCQYSHGGDSVEGDRDRESLRSSLGMVFPSLFTAASRKDADRAYVGSGTDCPESLHLWKGGVGVPSFQQCYSSGGCNFACFLGGRVGCGTEST